MSKVLTKCRSCGAEIVWAKTNLGKTQMKTPLQRFMDKADTNGECWEWRGQLDRGGYGVFKHSNVKVQAHRFAYEYFISEIPEGLEIDHLCRNRACVNPYHLEPVTHLENVRRGEGALFFSRKTHCPQGHPYNEVNTYNYRGRRSCRICIKATSKAFYLKKREAERCF